MRPVKHIVNAASGPQNAEKAAGKTTEKVSRAKKIRK